MNSTKFQPGDLVRARRPVGPDKVGRVVGQDVNMPNWVWVRWENTSDLHRHYMPDLMPADQAR